MAFGSKGKLDVVSVVGNKVLRMVYACKIYEVTNDRRTLEVYL